MTVPVPQPKESPRPLNSPTSKLRGYRPALDGVRAVAVGSVILYHLGYRWMRGGFLGVDVFFVLSGYLITSLLLADSTRAAGIRLAYYDQRVCIRAVGATAALGCRVRQRGHRVQRGSGRNIDQHWQRATDWHRARHHSRSGLLDHLKYVRSEPARGTELRHRHYLRTDGRGIPQRHAERQRVAP